MGPLNERVKRYLTFATGLFECISFTGVIFGWASLVFVLKKDEYFSDLCVPLHNSSDPGARNRTMDCDLQDEHFALIFTLASFITSFAAIPSGFLFDHFGTMVTHFLAIFLYTSATLMIAFSTATSAALLFPALCLIAVGGRIFFITNIQVGNLFGNKRFTVITLYNGAFSTSPAVFLLVKVLYEAGFSLRSMFLFISCLSSLHILRTCFLLPRTHIPYPLPEDYTYGVTCEQFGLKSFSHEEETESQRKSHRGMERVRSERREETDREWSDSHEETEGDRGERKEGILEDQSERRGEMEGDRGERRAETEGDRSEIQEKTGGDRGKGQEMTEGGRAKRREEMEGDWGKRQEMMEGDRGERREEREGDRDERQKETEGDRGKRQEETEGYRGERQEETEGDRGERQEETEGGRGERREETKGDQGKRHKEMEMIDGVNPQSHGPKEAEGNEEEIPSFRSCIFSKLFLTHLLWLSIMQLRINLFVGTLNPMLSLLTSDDPGQVSKFTNAFAFTQLCGIPCASWNGLIMDRHKHRARPSDPASDSAVSQRLADMKSAVLSLAVTVTQSILFSLCAAIPVLKVQYLTFILHVVSGSFLYGGHTAFTAIAFPTRHFGKVYGLLMALSAVVSLLQYPCFALVKGPLQGDPLYLNIGFIVLITLTYIHPINVYLHCRRETRQRGAVKPFRVEVPGLGEKDDLLVWGTDI